VTEAPEKRGSARVQPFVVRCLIVDGERRLPAYLTDLSATGAQVTVEGEPAAGSPVVVEVRLGRDPVAGARRLAATVQWARDDTPPPPPSFGVVFRINDEERAAIEAVLGDVRRRASQL
jgi:PilZ domain-containing protein